MENNLSNIGNADEEFDYEGDQSSLGLLNLDSFSEMSLDFGTGDTLKTLHDCKEVPEQSVVSSTKQLQCTQPETIRLNALEHLLKPTACDPPDIFGSFSNARDSSNLKSFQLDEEYLKKCEEEPFNNYPYHYSTHNDNKVELKSDHVSKKLNSGGAPRLSYSHFNDIDNSSHNVLDFLGAQASLGSFGMEPSPKLDNITCFASDKTETPIFKADDGEYVTNLAYHTNLDEEFGVENNLSLISNRLQDQGFESFMSADEAVKKFKEDEEEFNAKNALKISKNTFCSSDNQADNSWVVTSTIQDITRPSWLSPPSNDQSFVRLSIGQFIRTRTEDLGSLNNKGNQPRPYFGSEIHSPPQSSEHTREQNHLPVIAEGAFSAHNSLNDETIDLKPDPLSTSKHQLDTDSFETSVSSSNKTVFGMNTILQLMNDASLSKDQKALAEMIMNFKKPKRNFEESVGGNECSVSDCKQEARNFVTSTERRTGFKVPISPVPKIQDISKIPPVSERQPGRLAAMSTDIARSKKTEVDFQSSGVHLHSKSYYVDELTKLHSLHYDSNNENFSPSEIKDLHVDKLDFGDVKAEGFWKEPRLSSIYFKRNNIPSYLSHPQTFDTESKENLNQIESIDPVFPNVNSQQRGPSRAHLKERNSILPKESRSHVRILSFNDTTVLKSPPYESADPIDNSSSSIAFKIEVPEYLHFNETQCIGVGACQYLYVSNSSSGWIQCALQITQLKCNGKKANAKEHFGLFVFDGEITIEPFKTGKIKVTFLPTSEASYEATLQLLVSSLSSSGVKKAVPSLVTITAAAEMPKIKLFCSQDEPLDFGTIVEGCSITRPVTLVNLGKADVPLRLYIQTKTPPPSFKFCEISNTSDQIKSISSNILSCVLPGNCTDSLKVYIVCQAPHLPYNKIEINSVMSLLNVELEVPNSSPFIVNPLPLVAKLGFVKLHIRCSEESLNLNAAIGTECRCEVKLMNSGNVPLYLKVHTSDDVHFNVSPSEIALYPSQHGLVELTLKPQSISTSLKSKLFFTVQPNGYIYEVDVIGHIEMPKVEIPPPASRKLSETLTLESNKRHVCWGGVPVGSSVKHKIVIRNGSHEKFSYLKAFFRGSSDFQLLNLDEKLEDTQDIILSPRQELSVFVNYSPKIVSETNAKLVFRPHSSPMKSFRFSIKLSAYSGVSKLEVEGIQSIHSEGKTGHYININNIIDNSSMVFPVTVKNTGDRSMFVKILAFSDTFCKDAIPTQKYTVQPNGFVLPESEKKIVIVALKQGYMKDTSTLSMGSLYFISGDEIARQKFKAAMANTHHNRIKLPQFDATDPVFSVDFDSPFQNESQFSQDLLSHQDDISEFFSHLSRLPLQLHHSNTLKHNDSNFSVLTVDDTLFSACNDTLTNDITALDIQSVHCNSPPVKERKTQISNPNSSAAPNSWEIIPSEIILSETLNEGKSKIHILNHADQSQTFELSWPGDVLSISPANGVILRRDSSTIAVSLKDWQNIDIRTVFVYVTCGGEAKKFKVDIEGKKPKEANASNSSTKLSAKKSIPIQVNEELLFKDTFANCASGEKFEMFNASFQSVNWNLTPTASPFVQNNDQTSHVPFEVFSFSKLSGEIKARQTLFTEVNFRPRQIGMYIQVWKLQLTTKNKDVHSIKLKVMGKCMDKSTNLTIEKAEKPKKKSLDESLFISYDALKFPDTKVNSSSCTKVTIKNISNKLYKLQVVQPSWPFSVSHTTISVKPKCYTSFPVFFKPVKPGTFDVVLTVKSGLPNNLSVSLHGTAI